MVIVEALSSHSESIVKVQGILRENQWMDVLGTYRSENGFNFQRADIPFRDRDTWLAARQRAQTTPEATAKKSTSQKEAMKLFFVKNKGWSGSAVKSFWTPELKKQQAERFKPQKLAAIGGAAAKKKLSGIPRTEAVKEKMRIGQRAWMTPEQIKARAAAVKDAMASRRCYYGA